MLVRNGKCLKYALFKFWTYRTVMPYLLTALIKSFVSLSLSFEFYFFIIHSQEVALDFNDKAWFEC